MVDKYNGQQAEQAPVKPGSVARARQRVERGLQREEAEESQWQTRQQLIQPVNVRVPAPSSPAGVTKSFKTRQPLVSDGNKGQTISRPTQVPQWPLAGASLAAAAGPNTYRPPPGHSKQAPQRPPRPSRIPSMVDQARMQEPTPLFIAPVRTSGGPHDAASGQHVSISPISENPGGQPSAAGYAAESPLSGQGTWSRKPTVLGPPPSSRRGASSFYSNASFVSPIIEESPKSRSHGSYASSAAMPEAWGTGMPRSSPGYGDAFYEESITDKGRYSTNEDYGDVNSLMNDGFGTGKTQATASASQFRAQQNNGKATGRSGGGAVGSPEASLASWNASAASKQTPETSLGTITNPGGGEKIANPFTDANSPMPGELDNPALSTMPFSSRNSAMRRPPKLDIDAVRAAESRGSLTSLPDLIRRATRLAAMIDKGKRPTSRLDDLTEFLDEKGASSRDRTNDFPRGRPPSGLSDMLAAFPPPVQTPLNNGPGRGSWLRRSSWPLVPSPGRKAKKNKGDQGGRRYCCGLPVWACTLVTILLLCIIVAAIVVPLEIFVFKNIGNSKKDGLSIQSCQEKVPCLNGGTNVISQGSCSCICTGGFTGADCETTGSVGCTTTDLIATDGSSEIKNVTLGQAIPRLIAGANGNFSLSLSGTAIMAKFNKAELSCIAQNSLVTFNGRSARLTATANRAARIKRDLTRHSMRRSGAKLTGHPSDHSTVPEPMLSNPHSVGSEEDANGILARQDGSEEFTATETVLDFGRVAVLFVLQEKGLDAAQQAQSNLQMFFTKVNQGQSSRDGQVSERQAVNVTLSGDATVNLVDFHADMGNGKLVGQNNIDG